jgi:hypothetical protein
MQKRSALHHGAALYTAGSRARGLGEPDSLSAIMPDSGLTPAYIVWRSCGRVIVV